MDPAQSRHVLEDLSEGALVPSADRDLAVGDVVVAAGREKPNLSGGRLFDLGAEVAG